MSIFMQKNFGEKIDLNKGAIKNLYSELKVPEQIPILGNTTISGVKPIQTVGDVKPLQTVDIYETTPKISYDDIIKEYIQRIRDNRNTKKNFSTNFELYKNIEYGTLYTSSSEYMTKYNDVKNHIGGVMEEISLKLLMLVGEGVDIKTNNFDKLGKLLEDNDFNNILKSQLLKNYELDITGKTDNGEIVFLEPNYKNLTIDVIFSILEARASENADIKKNFNDNEKDILILLNDLYEGLHVRSKIDVIYLIIYKNEDKR